MIRYVFTDGPAYIQNRADADPQRIGEALDKARRDTPEGGDMRETAIQQARNRRNPLHRHLEWRDDVAAHEYRKHQINLLICAIRVESDSGELMPAFISVTPADGAKRFATPTEVVGSYELQVALLRAAERDLEAWTRRYRTLRDVCAIVNEARQTIAAQRAAAEEGRSASAA
jgi:hypothetical protein